MRKTAGERAVLVAISIPIFTTQLEKSRDSVSVSNMRAAYAEAQTTILTATPTKPTIGNATVTYDSTIPGQANSVVVTGVKIKSQQANDWSGLATDLPFTAPADATGLSAADQTITFTYTYGTDGEISGITSAFS